MISRIWLINILLAVFVAFFGFKAYGVWFQERPNTQTRGKTGKQSQAVQQPGTLLDKPKVPPEKEYAVVINQNLFSPERREILPEDKKPAAKEKKLYAVEEKNLKEMLDKMVLYGLVITETSAEALVSDVSYKPVVRMGRKLKLKKLTVGKTKWVKSGDMIGEFKVTKIEKDRIGLTVKGHDYVLLLYDKEKLKPHAPIKPKGGPTVLGVTGAQPAKASPVVKPTPNRKVSSPAQKQSSKKNPTIKEMLKNPTRK